VERECEDVEGREERIMSRTEFSTGRVGEGRIGRDFFAPHHFFVEDSVLDIIAMKSRDSQLFTNCKQLKFAGKDGKFYATDCASVEGLFRIIQSIPSPKVEPFKRWMGKRVKRLWSPPPWNAPTVIEGVVPSI
jgi:hypothetical protein